MRMFMAIAAVIPLALSAAAAPAFAETTVIKKVSHGEFGGRKKVIIKKHRMGGTTVKKIIKHDD